MNNFTPEELQARSENWYGWLLRYCRKNHISARRAFMRAGVEPQRVYRWTKKNPLAIQALVDIEKAVKDMIEERNQRGLP